MTHVREIRPTRALHLATYRDVDNLVPLLDELSELGRKTSELLGAHRVWVLSSTASGGGVAEMLSRECNVLSDTGVDTRWLVLEPDDPDFFEITKSVHNSLHGAPGLKDIRAARAIYERVSEEAAQHLAHVGRRDVLIVHDPQPVGAAIYFRPELRPRLIWRSHIGVPETNENTEAGWSFMRPYLVPYERLLFSSASYVPPEYFDKSGVLHPGIDPLSHKNRPLRPYKLIGVLHSAGVVEGPPVPEWARYHAPVLRFVDGKWEARPIPNLLHVPVVLQVSRFDRLKGFAYLIPAFASLMRRYRETIEHRRVDTLRANDQLARAYLLLAGPDPAGVVDDPEAGEVVADLCAQQMELPPDIRERVHILRLPMKDAKENALIVNALQSLASVVVQNSVKEGFGLTVSEALWKSAPFVGSNVGGIGIQVRDNTDGLLVDDPTDSDALAELILRQIISPMEAEAMGRSGRNRVHDHFLLFSQVRRWLIEIQRLLARPEPTRRPGPERLVADEAAAVD